MKSSAYSLYSVSAVSVVILLYDYWGIIIKQFGRLLMLSNMLFYQFSSVTCLPVLSMLIHSPFSLTSAVFAPNKKPRASSYLQGIISSPSLLTKPYPSLDFTNDNPLSKAYASSYLQGIISSPSLLTKPQPFLDRTIANPLEKIASLYLQEIISSPFSLTKPQPSLDFTFAIPILTLSTFS